MSNKGLDLMGNIARLAIKVTATLGIAAAIVVVPSASRLSKLSLLRGLSIQGVETIW
jgi:hypothetical protein